jgi:hypothetical protein
MPQFNIICTYTWHYHRDEYSWHMWLPNEKYSEKWAAVQVNNSKNIVGATTDYSFVNWNNSHPIARPFIHYRHHAWRGYTDVQMAYGARRHATQPADVPPSD